MHLYQFWANTPGQCPFNPRLNNVGQDNSSQPAATPMFICVLPRGILLSQISFTIYFLFAFVVPLSITTNSYCKFFIYLRKRATISTMSACYIRSKYKALRMLVLIVVSFLLSWGPIMFTDLATVFGVKARIEGISAKQIAISISLTNSVIHPVLYSFGNANFRWEVVRTFRRCKMWILTKIDWAFCLRLRLATTFVCGQMVKKLSPLYTCNMCKFDLSPSQWTQVNANVRKSTKVENLRCIEFNENHFHEPLSVSDVWEEDKWNLQRKYYSNRIFEHSGAFENSMQELWILKMHMPSFLDENWRTGSVNVTSSAHLWTVKMNFII